MHRSLRRLSAMGSHVEPPPSFSFCSRLMCSAEFCGQPTWPMTLGKLGKPRTQVFGARCPRPLQVNHHNMGCTPARKINLGDPTSKCSRIKLLWCLVDEFYLLWFMSSCPMQYRLTARMGTKLRRGQSLLSRWGLLDGLSGLFISLVMSCYPSAATSSIGKFNFSFLSVGQLVYRNFEGPQCSFPIANPPASCPMLTPVEFDLVCRRLIAAGAPKDSNCK